VAPRPFHPRPMAAMTLYPRFQPHRRARRTRLTGGSSGCDPELPMRRFRALLMAVLATAAVRSSAAAARLSRRGLGATATKAADGARLAVLSAFPAELAPLVAAATVDTTVEADGRQSYLGRLEGVRVVLGPLGIGTVNAASRTTSVIGNFEPSGIILSGVAGSHY